MALFRKFFYRKPPDGLLEISERVYVFDCCFTTDVLEEQDYDVYIRGIVAHLREHFPDASFMVFNFREGEHQSHLASILSEYDTTVMDYPRQYEGCPLLTMEMVHHFLRSSESWLSLGQNNILLMHCERGGWPVLAFMLAGLLIYRKQYTGEHKTLDMIYKQAPRELLQLLSPLDPIPSQLRYLQYVSRRNVGSEWPPLDRALTLDCVILRILPNFSGEGGCRPVFRIYGQDPLIADDKAPKVLFSTPKKSKSVRLYKADCELVKIDIHCHIQGDVVLECVSLDEDLDREEMMFRVMFNTAFIRSNILMLNRDEIDILWNAKDRYPKDFRAEVILSEMDAVSSVLTMELATCEEKEGLPVEAFAKVQEIFSNVDWLDARGDAALHVLQHIASSNALLEKLESASPNNVENGASSDKLNPDINKGMLQLLEAYDGIKKLSPPYLNQQPVPFLKHTPDSSPKSQSVELHDLHAASQHPSQPKLLSQHMPTPQSTPPSSSNSLQGSPTPLSRYHSAPSDLGITALLHDHAAFGSSEVTHTVTMPPSTTFLSSGALPCLSETSNTALPLPTPSSPPVPSLLPFTESSRTIVSRNSLPLSPPRHPFPLPSTTTATCSPTAYPAGTSAINASLMVKHSQLLSPSPAPSSMAAPEVSSPTVASLLLPVPLKLFLPSQEQPVISMPSKHSQLHAVSSVKSSSHGVPTPSPSSCSETSSPSDSPRCGKNSHVLPMRSLPSSKNIDPQLATSPCPSPPPLMDAPSISYPPTSLKKAVGAPPPPPPLSFSEDTSKVTSLRPPCPPMKKEVGVPPPPPPLTYSGTSFEVTSRPPLSPMKNAGGEPPSPPSSPPSCFGITTTVASLEPSRSPMKKAVDAPLPPPPPPPPLSCSGPTSTVISPKLSLVPMKKAVGAPPPPPPPSCSGPTSTVISPQPSLVPMKRAVGAPPSPPPSPCSSPTTPAISSSTPPPPPSPQLSLKAGLTSHNSGNAPPVPPPPLSLKGSDDASFHSNSSGNMVACEVIPPPPANGMGGPPAAPLGIKGRSLARPSSRNTTAKKSNLKPLHWVKVTRAMQGSLWAEAQKTDEASKAPEFDMSELESLFSASVPNADTRRSSDKSSGRSSLGQKSDKVQLIDLRRANNCEIMLTKVKMPLTDLMSSLLALDDSVLDVDQIDNLIKFCPTKEEMDLLKNFSGDRQSLGRCEQYFLELMKVPRVESKLRVFSFKIQFRSQVADLSGNLNIVNSAASEIRNSAKLKRVMQTILSLGNALNQGTARGSAIGFRLDSLLKLTDTRARNNKMTLMHYLCKVIAEKLPELLDFSQDLVSLEVSSKIQLKTLAEEMQAISKGLEKVEQELTASENDGPISETFHKTLKEFLVVAEAEVRSLTSLYSNVGRNADALALYFGEDPARCPFEQVVSTLLNFVKMFARAHEDNCKQLEMEKKKAQKEANSEKMKVATAKKELDRLSRSSLTNLISAGEHAGGS